MEVHLHHVSKQFGAVAALHDVSVRIPSGRKVAIIGPNGSGKSTLTRIVMGMLSYAGEILLDGQAPAQHRVALAKHLAYVPQCPPLIAASVADVLRLVARLRNLAEGRIVEVAAELDLHVPAIADRPLKNLSSGMKQKLLIALALAGDARLYILDEPTASLDPAARGRFYERFRTVASSATLLLCSHRLEEIQHLVDDIVLLDGGRVVFHGAVSEFLARHASCVIEVHVRSETAGTWLSERGFIRSSHLAWVKHVESQDKLAVTRQIMVQLNGQLENLNVRDLETISLPQSGGPP